ncbi:YL1 nuclear protein-domain-containing protein [Paraphoma chrysanthemicola]|uniref:YL1 nuclear protein-domain-containing protein n=1 Tax=Paraphoma chrysanthemicola TaxID=798071 RepID=A0A8K0QSE7_9PLEO|nr:YL1 nuclear protein-domain-containing protein [Paraphoma chrysanthemicola]
MSAGVTEAEEMAVAVPDDRSGSESSEEESEDDAPAELMVTTRERRANAGNRMSTLLAKSAEEEEWGEEWEEAPNEEEFQGDDVNEQADYNMDSSSSDEDDDGADDDDAGEKELRRAERQEKSKKRKAVTNPFAARVAAVTRKKVKLDLPRAQSPVNAAARPKKKSERASWLPTEEDGPVRASARTQTVANKEATLSKLMEKDKRRDDTLAMMKAAEARKKKDEPKPLTQAERLAEAARNERVNKKTLHRWEEAEEARAAERQAKIDAMKNRKMEGPFIRFYSGPGIWIDDKVKYTGKNAPTIEQLEEKHNKELLAASAQTAESKSEEVQTEQQLAQATNHEPQHPNGSSDDPTQPTQESNEFIHDSTTATHTPTVSAAAPQTGHYSQLPWTAASEAAGGDVFMGSHGMSLPNNIMFAPPPQDSFLFGIDQYAQHQHSQPTPSDLPPNPFTQASPYHSYTASQSPFPQQHSHTTLNDPSLTQHGTPIGSQALLQQFQHPPTPPAPPRRKTIKRALRNLLILSDFPNLDLPPTSSRARTTASLVKDKDRAALIQLSSTIFGWSIHDATSFVNLLLTTQMKSGKRQEKRDREAALKPVKPLCAVTNAVARYRDPETGIAYRDARAFGVLRGVVGGGFVWSGDLGCYVGGRAKPLESMGGKGFLGMPPAKGVPKRFLEMPKLVVQSPSKTVEGPAQVDGGGEGVEGPTGEAQQVTETVKTESVTV